VHSSLLQFTRDGHRLVVAEPDAVTVFELRGDGRRRLAIPGVQAVAAFTEQIWVATRTGALIRLASDGRHIDEHPLPVDHTGDLTPAMVGGPAAVWTAREPIALVDDLGTLAITPVQSGVVIPILGRRIASYAGSRLVLPAGNVVTLASGDRVTGGCAVFEGTALALVIEHTSGRGIGVAALANGHLLRTVALPRGRIRIAARRGLAIVHDAPRRISILDLRFARSLGTVVTDDDVTDAAIDSDGGVLALRFARGDVELVTLGQRTTAVPRRLAARAEALPEDAAAPDAQQIEVARLSALHTPRPEPPSPELGAREPPLVNATRAEPEPVIAAPTAPPLAARSAINVDALDPRPVRTRLPREAALVEIDREIRSVTLWTLQAISVAWDTRRLGYGDEGLHPYEHEVAALVGRNAGFAEDYVAAASEALAEHEAALASDPQHRGASTPVAELIDEFGLSATAIDVLLVIAAPALNGDVARLYGILGNDPGRALVDELLVQRVLGGLLSRHDVAAELHPRASLVRLGIVDVKPSRPRPFAALEVDPVVISRLRGEAPDLGVAPVVRHADRAFDAIEISPDVFASASEALARATRPARIAVRSRAGTGRRTLLAAFADQAGRSLGVIDATVLPRDADRFADALKIALRRAQLAGLLPVVHGLDAVVFHERSGTELAHETLAAHPGPLAVLSRPGARPPLSIGHVLIDLPAMSETERLGIWQRALAATNHWLRDVAGVAARYRVGAGVIHRAIAAVTAHDPMTPCDDRIDMLLRQSRDLRLADHARRIDHLASWTDLVLPSDIMDSLRELIARVRHRRTVFEDWGMGRTMATSRGLTALFQGQPGTGKTLVAGVIARELGLDLYQVDLSKVMSKWIGETERNLATIFDAAEDGQVILLFDEADSLFAKRTEVRSSNDRYANLEVNYLLQRLDSFDGIAILTTNSGGSIDPAFKRRLSFQLSFPFPDEETRAELWRSHLPRELPRAGELTFDALARKYQLSGGYIRNACLRAAFLAAQEETTLHQHHLERAVALEFAELGKLSTTSTIA